MYRLTNIETFGTVYTVADTNGVVIKTIQVIPHSEILAATIGEYTDEFPNMQTYLEKSIELLEGFEEVDMYRVYWYATTDEEVVLKDIIEYAIQYGYDKIIVEQLDPTPDGQ